MDLLATRVIGGVILGLVIGLHCTTSHMLGNDPTRRAEYLDPQGKFLLEWETLWSVNRILFNVTVETRGYVALGFSANGEDGSSTGPTDILIAGVLQRGKAYFLDHHILQRGGNPRLDPSQDYTLHSAWESKTHTFVSFSRPLDSCDPQDYPITDNKITLTWAYGQKDDHEVSWGYCERGTYDVYLLDPDYSPKIERDPNNFSGRPKVVSQESLSVWTIPSRMSLPNNDTSYLCNIHRGPNLQKKHHVVGFDIHFANEESRQTVHHLIILKCNAPEGISLGVFEPFVGGPAQTCYLFQRPPATGPIPTYFCTELYFGWAVGGKPFFTPPHVGFPLSSSPNEYYMLQVHYNNPQRRPDLVVDFRVDFFYTSQLRAQDGAVMGLGHDIPGLSPSLLVPPNTANHNIFGHCSPECTRRMFPPGTGIKIFAGLLHSHLSGRRMRLRHFSSTDPKQEQPWIQYDDNYSFNYQTFRHLHQERQILPGDQVTMECTYDSTWANGSSVVGGYATRQEMCFSFFVYYNRLPDYSQCRSEIVSDEYRQRFLGITNVTWTESSLNWVATDTSSLAGLTVQEISDTRVDWNRNRKEELRRFHEMHPHVGKCSRELYSRSAVALQALMQSGAVSGPVTGQVPLNINTPDDFSGPVGYPQRVRPYVPPKTCEYRGWGSPINNKRFYHYL